MIVFLSSLLCMTTFIPGLVRFGLNPKQLTYSSKRFKQHSSVNLKPRQSCCLVVMSQRMSFQLAGTDESFIDLEFTFKKPLGIEYIEIEEWKNYRVSIKR